VDTFLALSGFLITGGLISEQRSFGRIALRRFWLRRARRLLPALLVLLAAAGVYATFVALPDAAHRLRLDALSALGFFSNWRFLVSGQGYFAQSAAPSLLRHTWSLAVEGQLYLLWPLVVAAVAGRNRLSRLWAVALGLAAVSTALGVVTRSYYGTDTRAVSFLVGAALAAALNRHPSTRSIRWLGAGVNRHPSTRSIRWLGATGLAVTMFLWATLSGTSDALFRGALPLAGLTTAAVIADVVLRPAGRLSLVLSARPLRGLGTVSYGVYLWHWPLIIVLDHQLTGLSGLVLLVVRLGATALATAASWVLVERPILYGRVQLRQGRRTPVVIVGVSVALVAALVAVPAGRAPASTLTGFSARIGPATPPQSLAAGPGVVPAVMFGDSVAVTLAAGMQSVAASYHVDLGDGAEIGCGVALGDNVRSLGHVSPLPAPCRSWPDDWQRWVDTARPAVSIVLLGRWEVLDRRLAGGGWQHLGEAAFDDYVARQLDAAVKVAGSQGGTVVLCTAPYYQGVERPQGGSWPENAASRVDRFNQLVRAEVARHPNTVLFDLNALVSPSGHYRSVIDGSAIRSDDGVHFSAQGGAYVAARLLTLVASLAGHARLGSRRR
jgi:peptidoglycan/LPS O-acetylase OafA/YrhL